MLCGGGMLAGRRRRVADIMHRYEGVLKVG